MSARIDGELDDRHQRRFDRHIAGCRRCARVLASLRRTLDDLRAMSDQPSPVTRSVVDDVLGQIAGMPARDSDGRR
ncbi:MAG TPA: zf-HC2 domain-containing protein [Acidimicrobiales bacterium]|nr:zf-HC2 domain-containing protein [Acidimicrobiales bacterium]